MFNPDKVMSLSEDKVDGVIKDILNAVTKKDEPLIITGEELKVIIFPYHVYEKEIKPRLPKVHNITFDELKEKRSSK